jgi:hypothetical protein
LQAARPASLLLLLLVVVVVGFFSLCFFAGASFRCFLFCWLASFPAASSCSPSSLGRSASSSLFPQVCSASSSCLPCSRRNAAFLSPSLPPRRRNAAFG